MLPPSPDPPAQVTADAGSARLRNADRFTWPFVSGGNPASTPESDQESAERLPDFAVCDPVERRFSLDRGIFHLFSFGYASFRLITKSGEIIRCVRSMQWKNRLGMGAKMIYKSIY